MYCRQKTELRPQVTCTPTENFVKFGHVVFQICEWIDRQTDEEGTYTRIAIFRPQAK